MTPTPTPRVRDPQRAIIDGFAATRREVDAALERCREDVDAALERLNVTLAIACQSYQHDRDLLANVRDIAAGDD
jgi:hypothetical protein